MKYYEFEYRNKVQKFLWNLNAPLTGAFYAFLGVVITFAYTMANIKPEKRGEILTISNILENHFINIDYLIYIETSPQIAWKRKNNVIEDIETGNNSDKNTDTRTLFINNQTSANKYYKLFFQNKTNLLKLSGEMDKDILSDIIYRKVSGSIE